MAANLRTLVSAPLHLLTTEVRNTAPTHSPPPAPPLPLSPPLALSTAAILCMEGPERKRARRCGRSRSPGAPFLPSATAEKDRGAAPAAAEERDPVVLLGPDIMTKVMGMMDARSVARSIVVSRKWQEIASADRIWRQKCEELWNGKAHIPRSSTIRGATMLEAYSLASLDGKRVRITKEDLCDHAWEFHFKKAAPEYWRNLDPSWKDSGSAMRRYFHPDGSQTADPTDQVWGGHECRYTIVTSFFDGKMREHYVRINRWPKMSVSRKEDWSWMMGNDLYYYLSIPDAEKEGGTGPLFPFW